MKTKFSLSLLIIFLLTFVNSFSQVNSLADKKFRFFEKPYIELNNGISRLSIDGFKPNFSNAGIVELKLGSATQYKSRYGKDVLKYLNSYISIGKVSSSLDYTNKPAGTLPFDMWRFTAGKKEGYGLKLGSTSLTPFTSSSLTWNYLDMRNFPDASMSEDNTALLNFNKATRFGTQAEGGLIFNITPMISIQANYERQAIFPRTLFWKYIGSAIIEEGGMQLLDDFVGRILKNEPVAGVIVNFVLKNAYSYGIYELRKSKMNWPFNTEAPLMHESFKFGVSFTF
jgi:hypothetical protein